MKKAKMFRQKVTRVLVMYRPDTSSAQSLATELAEWLHLRKIKVFSHPDQKLHVRSRQVKAARSARGLDLVCVLGGDGTYLEAVRWLAGERVPILGVNLGSLGFLTVAKADDLYRVLQMTLEGKMQTRPRTMIRIIHKRKGHAPQRYSALNDLVLERGSQSRLINLLISIDSQLIGSVKADGLILATPTGSTAYNLAAGGPILHPEVEGFVITPICPHSLTNRPLMVPDNKRIILRLKDSGERATLTLDGRRVSEMRFGDEIWVERHECDHLVLRQPSHNYFNLLREKLKFGERA